MLNLKAHTVFKNSLTRQKLASSTRNLVQNLMKLVFFFLKSTGRDRNMTKTKVVQKNANRRRSETAGEETGQDSEGSNKRGFFCLFFSLSNVT